MNKRTYNILLVEDNPGDIRILKEVLLRSPYKTNLISIFDGEEVLNYLEQASLKIKAYPDLILLDLNLPKINGIDVVKNIKRNNKFKHTPIVILTSSNSESDIIAAYKNHANSYIVKPLSFEDSLNKILEILEYWFNIVRLPYGN